MTLTSFTSVAATKLSTVVVLFLLTTTTYAGESGFTEDNGSETLSEFYFHSFLEKALANDQLTLTLVKKTKKVLSVAMRTGSQRKETAIYQDFLNRLQETVLNSRKASTRDCAKLAGKFNNLKIRSSTAANCKTEREIHLERRLFTFQIELKRLSI